MTSNLNWIRVNDLPDFVYFNHQIQCGKASVRDLPRAGRQDAADVSGAAAPDGVVPRLPPRARRSTCGRATEVFNMAYEAPANQLEVGMKLKQDYNVASVEHMTSCSVCHR